MNMFPCLSLPLPSYRGFCVVAVDQNTGAFGVGFCPCVARHHLSGFPGLGVVLFFAVHNTFLRVVRSGEKWVVEGADLISDLCAFQSEASEKKAEAPVAPTNKRSASAPALLSSPLV